MPANASIQDYRRGVLHTLLLDWGVRRNDGNAVDFQSTNSEPLGFEPRVVQFPIRTSQLCDLCMW